MGSNCNKIMLYNNIENIIRYNGRIMAIRLKRRPNYEHIYNEHLRAK